MLFTVHVQITFVKSSRIILSDQFLCIFSKKVQFNEKPPHWFTDAQQGTNGNLMFLSMLTDLTLLHISVLHSSDGVHITVCQSKVAPGQLQ